MCEQQLCFHAFTYSVLQDRIWRVCTKCSLVQSDYLESIEWESYCVDEDGAVQGRFSPSPNLKVRDGVLYTGGEALKNA